MSRYHQAVSQNTQRNWNIWRKAWYGAGIMKERRTGGRNVGPPGLAGAALCGLSRRSRAKAEPACSGWRGWRWLEAIAYSLVLQVRRKEYRSRHRCKKVPRFRRFHQSSSSARPLFDCCNTLRKTRTGEGVVFVGVVSDVSPPLVDNVPPHGAKSGAE